MLWITNIPLSPPDTITFPLLLYFKAHTGAVCDPILPIDVLVLMSHIFTNLSKLPLAIVLSIGL